MFEYQAEQFFFFFNSNIIHFNCLGISKKTNSWEFEFSEKNGLASWEFEFLEKKELAKWEFEFLEKRGWLVGNLNFRGKRGWLILQNLLFQDFVPSK